MGINSIKDELEDLCFEVLNPEARNLIKDRLINIKETNLISFKSVTPFDDNCQEYIASYLQELGFDIQYKKYDDVTNLIARYGKEKPVLAYVGLSLIHI